MTDHLPLAGQILAHRLAAAHDALAAQLGLIEAEVEAGQLDPVLGAEQAAMARAAHDRDVAAARADAGQT